MGCELGHFSGCLQQRLGYRWKREHPTLRCVRLIQTLGADTAVSSAVLGQIIHKSNANSVICTTTIRATRMSALTCGRTCRKANVSRTTKVQEQRCPTVSMTTATELASEMSSVTVSTTMATVDLTRMKAPASCVYCLYRCVGQVETMRSFRPPWTINETHSWMLLD